MYGEKHLARVQARIRAAGDHLVEIMLASGAPWRRALEREGRASKCRATHKALDAENGHCWLPWRTGRRPVARAWPSRHLVSAIRHMEFEICYNHVERAE